MFLGLLITGCCQQNLKTNQVNTKLNFINHINESVVAFPNYGPEGNFRGLYCSGFFVDEKHIVTARHCLIDTSKIDVHKAFFGTGDDETNSILYNQMLLEEIDKIDEVPILKYENVFPIQTKLVYMNIKTVGEFPDFNDVAILEVINKADYSKYWLKFSNTEPIVSDKVFSINHLNQNPWFYTEGVIAKLFYEYEPKENKKTLRLLTSNMTVFPGASGAALLNKDGEVLGLTSYVQIYKNGQMMDFGFYVSYKQIDKFYRSILDN